MNCFHPRGTNDRSGAHSHAGSGSRWGTSSTRAQRGCVASAAITGICAVVLAAMAAPALAASRKPTPDAVPMPAGALEPAAAPAMPTYDTKGNFSFAVLGDSAPPAPDLPVPSVLFRLFDDIGTLRPDILFHTGNFVWVSPGDQAGAQVQMDRFRLSADGLQGIPIFVAPGPRDVPDEEADVVFRKLISGGQPWRSFDYGNSHFIVLDTEVPNEVGKIAGDQMTWLQSDLDTHSQAAHTFVFLNRAPYPTTPDAPADDVFSAPADRDSFTGLMSKYHVTTVFSGGQPLYSSSTQDGVNYVNTGGGGSPSTAAPENGGFIHYVLVTVSGDNVSVAPLEPGRVDVRFAQPEPGVATVYNSSPFPLTVNHVAIAVPSVWRAKHVGLLGAARLAVYQVTAAGVGPNGAGAEAAAVDLEPGKSVGVGQPDVLYVRVLVPADSAVNIKIQPAP